MKKKKNKRLHFIWGFIIAWLVGIITFLGILFTMYQEPFKGQDLTDNVINNAFTRVSNSWENTQVVDSLSYLCSLNEDDLEKVRCVYNFILLNTEYGYHDGETNTLRKPEEMFNETIVCRDTAVLVKATLDKMNISNEFVNEPSHIYNIVYFGKDNLVCYVDVVNGIFKCGNLYKE